MKGARFQAMESGSVRCAQRFPRKPATPAQSSSPIEPALCPTKSARFPKRRCAAHALAEERPMPGRSLSRSAEHREFDRRDYERPFQAGIAARCFFAACSASLRGSFCMFMK